jgi:hypothetical protein
MCQIAVAVEHRFVLASKSSQPHIRDSFTVTRPYDMEEGRAGSKSPH